MAARRIGVITAGGDCPGLNAVIRAVVKKAVNDFGAEAVGFLDGFRGLVLDHHTPLTYESVSSIIGVGGTILGSSNRDNPFQFYYDDDQKEPVDASQKALDTYERHGLSALICIGGDGTLSMSHEFCKKGLKIVGVPKTIDNDVQGTDQTFGFDSAVATACDALDKIRTTAASHHRAMVVELMGRTAGWLTLFAGIATGGDIILIPEMPFSAEGVCGFVKRRSEKGRRYSILCVAEGAHQSGKDQVLLEGKGKRTGMVRLGGIGQAVAEMVQENTGVEARTTVLGHIQRGGSPTTFDRILATRYGAHAIQLAMDGVSGVTVCLKGGAIDQFPLDKVANNPRRVSPDSEFVRVARSTGAYLGE